MRTCPYISSIRGLSPNGANRCPRKGPVPLSPRVPPVAKASGPCRLLHQRGAPEADADLAPVADGPRFQTGGWIGTLPEYPYPGQPSDMAKIWIVNRARLDSANYSVTLELDRHGFYDGAMQAVETHLVAFGSAYGWQWFGGSGHINIPRVSLSRLSDLWQGSYVSLRDVLRHEFAHALADTHRGLFRSRRFSEAFGAAHTWEFGCEYDPEHHVTPYASIAPAEDFAEVFMLYLRCRGRLPSSLATDSIVQKWRFVEDLGRRITGSGGR